MGTTAVDIGPVLGCGQPPRDQRRRDGPSCCNEPGVAQKRGSGAPELADGAGPSYGRREVPPDGLPASRCGKLIGLSRMVHDRWRSQLDTIKPCGSMGTSCGAVLCKG